MCLGAPGVCVQELHRSQEAKKNYEKEHPTHIHMVQQTGLQIICLRISDGGPWLSLSTDDGLLVRRTVTFAGGTGHS